MKHIADYKENYDTHIELTAVLKLNKKERVRFARHNNGICAGDELYVQLPFGGMVIVDKSEFMTKGVVTISHWTDKKDSWYEGDEEEFRVLDSMIEDDVIAVKKLVGFESRARVEVACPW